MHYLSMIAEVQPAQWARAVACLLVCALLIRLTLPMALRFGVVDRPGGRKDHDAPTAVTGGLAILLSVIAVTLVMTPDSGVRLQTFAVSAIALVAIGQLDDIKDINWRWRIGGQAMAALVMMYVAGVSVNNLQDVFGVTDANHMLFTIPFTVFIVVGVINALNMIDGVDGLAGSLALVSLGLFFGFAIYAGDIRVAGYILALAGGVVGFLVWNLRFPWQPRARVFLGNGGSMLLGLAIAWCSVQLTQNPVHPVSPVLGPWTIALPLIDCVVLMFRRMLQRRSPFAADRQHMHHLLLDAGFQPMTVVALLVTVSVVLGVGAAVALKLGVYRPLLVLVFLALIAAWFVFTIDIPRAIARLAWLRQHVLRAPAPAPPPRVEGTGEAERDGVSTLAAPGRRP